MPDNPSPGPAWKNQAVPPSKGAPSKGEAAVPAWKKEAGGPAPGGPRAWQTQPPAPAPRPTSKLTKLFAGLTLVGVLVGAVVAVILFLRVLKPASLIVLGASYDVNLSLPHNAHGWQGLNDLAQLAGRGTKEFEMRLAYPEGEPVELTDEASWQKQWHDALNSNVNAKTVLLHLALHGGADDSGAYLFLNEPGLKQRVYVTALLDDIVKQWPSKNILLILEPGPLDAHWHSGMLDNQFVPRLKNAVQDAAKKHGKLLVLCGCDEGQVCWSSDEWRRTIFTHYLAEGLQGAAAGGDDRVQVGELFDYVKKNVGNWAETNRGMRQTPILLGNGSHETELTQVEERHAERRVQDAPGLTPFTPSSDLTSAWAQCAKLAESAHPSAYTPQQWRRYRDSLVRWEQLERAGDPTRAADKLHKLCARLATDIERAAVIPAGEREITRALPLPGVLGIGPGLARDEQSEIQTRFKLLWTGSREKQRETLEELTKKAGPDQTKLIYLALCRELLRFLSTSATLERSEEVTVKARELIRFLEEQCQLPRPAELHYLVMLSEGLDAKALPPLDDLKQSLEVRVLAEQAALAAPVMPGSSAAPDAGPSYSEIVQPFIRAAVKTADDQRRLAEDWLFGAGPKEWGRARDLRGKALKGYKEALNDAAVVRHAVAARDRALADLPYFAAWLGKRYPQPNPDEEAALRKLTTQVEQQSQDIGDLTWCLTEPKVMNGFLAPLNSDRKREARTPKELMEQLAAAIESRHNGLHAEFRNYCNMLKGVDHQERWHELEAVLSVPLIEDVATRTHLLQTSHRLSQKLHQSDRAFAEPDRPPVAPDRAERQKRLALAALVANSEDKHPVGLHAKDTPAQLGRKIGAYWLEIPDRIAKQVKASDSAPDLDEAALKMRDAEFLCRLLPGGIDMAALKPPVLVSPPANMRRLRLHNLLLHQAERTKEDHWYDENGSPYYVSAGKAYAYLALDLVGTGGKNEALAAARRGKTEKFAGDLTAAGLKITPPANIDWTSELKFPLAWTLDADDGVPRGVPMYWLELQGERADAEDARFEERRAAEDWLPKSAEYSLVRRGKVDLYAEPTKANLVALYRGQKLAKQEVALRDWEPRTVVRQVPPATAGVAFRMAPDFNYGAIAFVLDASGSMFNKKVNGKTRWEHALLALEATLKKIPESTYVSLSLFATHERAGGVPKHQTLREPQLWRAAAQKDLMARLRELDVVQGASPIAKSIIKARDDGFPPPTVYRGPKLIVALTDGDDNWSFDQEPRDRDSYNQRVRTLLREQLNGRKIDVHVVCFNEQGNPEDQDEARRAEDQFKVVQEFKTPGTFRKQTEPGELAESLDLAIRPRLSLYAGAQLVPGFTREGVTVDRFGRALKWIALEPGHYTAWLPEEQKQDIHLQRGDFMILTLHRDAAGVHFKRTLLADEFADRLVGAPQIARGWSAAVLRNQITAKGDVVRHVVAIEEPPPAVAADVQQRRLNFVWLDLKPKATASFRQLVWQRDYTYAGSALSLRTDAWPFEGGRAAPGQLQAWWTTGPADHPGYANMLDPDSVQSLKQKFAKVLPLRAGTANLKIENVALESHDVEIGPNQRAPKPSLVFRISHDPQKPVFLQLRIPENYSLGEEHRYYPEANRYTAIFWNLPDPQNVRLALNVISIVDFQNSSEPATFTLPRPDQQPGPDPVPIAVLP